MMHTNTLQGVFPEPKPPYKKNFIKENVKYIKRMQGLIQEANPDQVPKPYKDKFQTVPVKKQAPRSVQTKTAKALSRRVSSDSVQRGSGAIPSAGQKKAVEKGSQNKNKKKNQKVNTEVKLTQLSKSSVKEELYTAKKTERAVSRGVQTERTDNLEKFLETGVIKYPSENVVKHLSKKTSPRRAEEKRFEGGDAPLMQGRSPRFLPNQTLTSEISDKIQSLNLAEKQHDFIRENILSLRQKKTKQENTLDPTQPPPTYQRGQLPKYLQERKEEQMKEMENVDEDCPAGHVLLPEDERKETLRVLRQSYAARIQELNSMPVKNDTLRMRKRKMVIEEELRKIDEGIKVFQRPKVYVKVNA